MLLRLAFGFGAKCSAARLHLERARLLRQACDVVESYIVELGQTNGQRKGNLALPLLVVRVGGFVHVQDFNQLGLGQILVFPQVAKAGIIHRCFPPVP